MKITNMFEVYAHNTYWCVVRFRKMDFCFKKIIYLPLTHTHDIDYYINLVLRCIVQCSTLRKVRLLSYFQDLLLLLKG